MTRLTLEQCDDIHELIEAMAENQERYTEANKPRGGTGNR